MLELGFTTKVMEFEEFYVIPNDEGTIAKLKLADTLLDEVIITAEEKRISTERCDRNSRGAVSYVWPERFVL